MNTKARLVPNNTHFSLLQVPQSGQISLFQQEDEQNISSRYEIISGTKVIKKRGKEFIQGVPLVQELAKSWELPDYLVREMVESGTYLSKLWTRTHYEQVPKARIVKPGDKDFNLGYSNEAKTRPAGIPKTALATNKLVIHQGYPESPSTYIYLEGVPYKIRHLTSSYDPEVKSPEVALSFRKHPKLPIGYVLVKSYRFTGVDTEV